jgi:hypothetical protein
MQGIACAGVFCVSGRHPAWAHHRCATVACLHVRGGGRLHVTILRRICPMKRILFLALACAATLSPALAQEVTYRGQVAPILKAQCAECHGADAPTLAEFKLDEEKYKKAKVGPRTDNYADLLQLIAYTDTGAFMRRLDDGANSTDKKPGNMYKHLGETNADRAKNLALLKAWVGEGAWNLNRWEKREDVPAITKEQLDKLKLKY